MRRILLIMLVILGLPACRPAQIGEVPGPLPSTVSSTQRVDIPATTTATPTPSSTPPPILDSTVNPDVESTEPTKEAEYGQLCSPLEGHPILELFEIVTDPYNPPPMGRDERHQGVDFSYYQRGDRDTIEGVVVQAILPGVVVGSFDDQIPYGNMVMIETPYSTLPVYVRDLYSLEAGQSLYHVYAHMLDKPEVTVGEQVACGQAIGQVGSTGYNIINAHLHLEVRTGESGKVFDVMSFYNTRATEEEMENYRLWRMSGEYQHYDPMESFEAYLNTQNN